MSDAVISTIVVSVTTVVMGVINLITVRQTKSDVRRIRDGHGEKLEQIQQDIAAIQPAAGTTRADRETDREIRQSPYPNANGANDHP